LVTPTINNDTPLPDFNNLVMDPDKQVPNTSQNILPDEEPKFYRQAISRLTTDLLHIIVEATMDAIHPNHTRDVVGRPADRKIVDHK
jgi:hypothetical protein